MTYEGRAYPGQGYTYGHPGRNRRDPDLPAELTDSAVRRGVGLGTIVRIHLWRGGPVDVALLDIMQVSTWRDLAAMVIGDRDLIVDGRTPRVITHESIVHVEVVDQ